MKLQILINHWREPAGILERLLRSIEEQRLCDGDEVEILICTDGEEYRLQERMFARFGMPIRYTVREHRGVCATRNTLLDLSDADYVMFCDCDDMFSRKDGLRILMMRARESGADIVGTCYDLETMGENGPRYTRLRRDIKRVHGKIFRLDYLRREHIRFPDEMAFAGDMYFLWLAYHLTDRIAWLDDAVYIWKWTPESVTRGAGKDFYAVRVYDKTCRCYMLTLEELRRRGMDECVEELAMALMHTSYIDWYSKEFRDAPEDCAVRARKTIREIVRELYGAYVAIPYEMRRRSYINMLIARRTYGPDGKLDGLIPWADAICEGADSEERQQWTGIANDADSMAAL